MDGKVNVLIRGKAELTRKRHQIDVLLKRAKNGNYQSKDKLYKEFGIRLYSSDEVQKYVSDKLKTEVEDSPVRIKRRNDTKTSTKRKIRLVGKK